MRKDRRQRIIDMVSKDLDTRSQWMGIKWIKRGYQPIPYTLKTEGGKRMRTGEKAEEAAKYLARNIWGKQQTDTSHTESRQKISLTRHILPNWRY